MTRYEHTQIGYVIIWVTGGAIALIAAVSISAPSPDRGVLFLVALLLLIVLPLFYKLTIKIDDEMLRACFGIGLISKKVPLAQIAACEPMRVPWWSGWGMRFTLTPFGWGWLYNVSGWDAVAIKLRNGREFALGTDDPHGLAEAIQAAIP